MKPKAYAILAMRMPQQKEWIPRIVAWGTSRDSRTWEKYSWNYCHSERIFSNGQSFSAQEKDYPDGTKRGVRFKDIKYSHPERWVFMRVPIFELEAHQLELAKSIEGLDYDWLGIFLWQLLPFHIEDKNAFYCSEANAFSLRYNPDDLNPNKLAYEAMKIIMDSGYGGIIKNFDMAKIKEYIHPKKKLGQLDLYQEFPFQH